MCIDENLEQLLIEFLRRHSYITDFRTQNITYLAELIYIERTGGKKLTDVTYRPYQYGVYSKQIDYELIKLYKKDTVVKKNKRASNARMYRLNSVEYTTSENIKKLAKLILDLTKYKSDTEIKEWCKSTYLFKNTRYESEVDFSKYVDNVLNNSKVIEDWKILL